MNDLIKEASALMDGGAILGTVSLVSFFVAYLVVLLRVCSRNLDERYELAAQMPLNDELED